MATFVAPGTADFAAAATAAAVASFQKKGMGMAAAEQLGASMAGANLAEYLTSTDTLGFGDADSTVQIREKDVLTGASRAGWSAYKKRSQNAILMDGAKGVMCNIAGRYLANKFAPAATSDGAAAV